MAVKDWHIMLCLIRCGQTTWQRQGRLHGTTSIPLSDGGRAALAEDTSRFVGASPAAIHHPSDEAATETAQAVAGSIGAKTRILEELADPNLGLLEGMLEERFARRQPKRYKQWQDDPLSLIPPEGEPIADARARLFLAIGKVLRKSRAREVGVVLHPIGFGLLSCWLSDIPAGELWRVIESGRSIQRYVVSAGVLDHLMDAATESMASS